MISDEALAEIKQSSGLDFRMTSDVKTIACGLAGKFISQGDNQKVLPTVALVTARGVDLFPDVCVEK